MATAAAAAMAAATRQPWQQVWCKPMWVTK
jgi:hypothetical protein